MLLLLYAANLQYKLSAIYAVSLLGVGCLAIIIPIILIVTFFVLIFKLSKKFKKEKKQIIQPITSIIGTDFDKIEKLNRELKPFGFKYEPYQDIFCSIMNGWQRKFGFCKLYDDASAPLSMIIDCEPITFEYNGLNWLIEFWKGQYGMNTGGEVGVYYTDRPLLNIPKLFNGTFYESVSDEHRIIMSFALRKNGNLLLTRSGYHWWLTGFKLAEFSHPSELTMDITLDLYDRTMVNAFVNGLKNAGYKENEFAVHGLRVYIHFSTPHTPQPATRTSFTEFLMQRNNEKYCKAYHRLTSEYVNTLDKLEALRKESPDMYTQALQIGKPFAVFNAYTEIKDYLAKKE